jgi:hypothetical protein
MRLRRDISDETCEAWVSLLVAYNDLRCERYRVASDPASPENAPLLERALNALHNYIEKYLLDDEGASHIRNAVPEQFKVSKANAKANFNTAESRFYGEDYPSTVVHLETALSAIHDLITALTNTLTEPPVNHADS